MMKWIQRLRECQENSDTNKGRNRDEVLQPQWYEEESEDHDNETEGLRREVGGTDVLDRIPQHGMNTMKVDSDTEEEQSVTESDTE